MKNISSKDVGVLFIYVLIGGLAFCLRYFLAGVAYPAQMDVPAMIAQGVLWAQGGGMGSTWPEIPVMVAGTAYRHGLDPARILQAVNVLYGTVIVIMAMILARRLFDRHSIAWCW